MSIMWTQESLLSHVIVTGKKNISITKFIESYRWMGHESYTSGRAI
jgi:hypothetical protein